MHEYVTIEESLVHETKVFKKQTNQNIINAQVNKVIVRNKKNTSTEVKKTYDNPGSSKKNTKRCRNNIIVTRSYSNLTEYNKSTPAISQPVKKKRRYITETVEQFQSLPMTRLPFQIVATTDSIVKIEQPKITSYNKALVTVFDGANISEVNLTSQPLSSEIRSVSLLNQEKSRTLNCKTVGTLSTVPQINQTLDSINSVTVTTRDDRFSVQLVPSIEITLPVISVTEEIHCIDQIKKIPVLMEKKKQQNTKYALRKKSIYTQGITKLEQNEIMVVEPIVMMEQDTNQLQVEYSRPQQLEKTNQQNVKEINIQNESNKIKLFRQLNEVTVNIEPLVYNLKKEIQKTTNPKKSNIRPKKQFNQFQTNVLKKEEEKAKKQKTVEEWRLEFNLLKVETVILERCDMIVPVTTVGKRVKKKKNRRRRKDFIKKVIKTKTKAVESCNNIQKKFNDGDFNLPDPTEITEHFLNYSHQSKRVEIKNLRSKKNSCFIDTNYTIFEYLDEQNSSIIKSSIELTEIESLEPRKDGFQYFEMFSDS